MSWTDDIRRVARSRRVRRGTRILGIALAAVVLVPFLVYAFPTLAGAKESYVVLSGSMQPSLAPGDVIVVYGTDPAAIEEGDVITFRRGGGTLVTHRVVNVTTKNGQRAFRTKGDANEEPDDELVPASAVVGRVPTLVLPFVGPVLVHIPALGHVIVFVNQSPVTFLVAIGAIIAVDELRKAISKRRSAADDGDREDPNGEAPSGDDSVGGTAADPGDGGAPDDALAGLSGNDGGSGGQSTGFVLTGVDLRLTAVVLVALATYGGVVGLLGRSPLALSIAAGAVVGLLAVGQTLYGSTERPDPDGKADRPEPVPTDEPVTGSVPDQDRLPVVAVDSPAELFERADDGWVVRDGDGAAYTDGAVLFRCELDDAAAVPGTGEEVSAESGVAERSADEPVADPETPETTADPETPETTTDEPEADDQTSAGFEFGVDGGDPDDD